MKLIAIRTIKLIAKYTSVMGGLCSDKIISHNRARKKITLKPQQT